MVGAIWACLPFQGGIRCGFTFLLPLTSSLDLTNVALQIDKLLVSDPKAMQFIFGTPATGHMFTKGAFARAFIKDLLGRGIIWAEGLP